MDVNYILIKGNKHFKCHSLAEMAIYFSLSVTSNGSVICDGYHDIINLHNGDILVINDNGKDVLDSNETATEIAHKHNAIFGWDYICGDVVMCKDEEVQ